MLRQPRPLVPFTFERRVADPLGAAGFKILLDARHSETLFKDTGGTTPVTSDGDAVALWKDRSGSGNDFQQSTGTRQPAYKTNVVNGLSVVRFNSSTVLGAISAALGLTNNIASITMMALLAYPDAASVHTAFAANAGASGVRSRIGDGATSGEYGVGGRRLDADSFVDVPGGTFTSGFVVQTSVLDYANADAVLRINGTQVAHSSSFQTAGNTSATNSVSILVGAQGSVSSPAQSFGGDMVVLAVAVPKLDSTTLASVEAYLKSIAGL